MNRTPTVLITATIFDPYGSVSIAFFGDEPKAEYQRLLRGGPGADLPIWMLKALEIPEGDENYVAVDWSIIDVSRVDWIDLPEEVEE